jgi:hypothetical protein
MRDWLGVPTTGLRRCVIMSSAGYVAHHVGRSFGPGILESREQQATNLGQGCLAILRNAPKFELQ